MSSEPIPARPEPRQMQMQWSTDAGHVIFAYPSNLSEQDVEDVERLLEVALRGMKRRATPAKEGPSHD